MLHNGFPKTLGWNFPNIFQVSGFPSNLLLWQITTAKATDVVRKADIGGVAPPATVRNTKRGGGGGISRRSYIYRDDKTTACLSRRPLQSKLLSRPKLDSEADGDGRIDRHLSRQRGRHNLQTPSAITVRQ